VSWRCWFVVDCYSFVAYLNELWPNGASCLQLLVNTNGKPYQRNSMVTFSTS